MIILYSAVNYRRSYLTYITMQIPSDIISEHNFHLEGSFNDGGCGQDEATER
jgi:hypothetical protein